MGKKRQRAKQVSKGEVGRPMRTRDRNPALRIWNQRIAWSEGRNVVLTIPNPNDKETNKRFIKVNAREVWGDPRRQGRV